MISLHNSTRLFFLQVRALVSGQSWEAEIVSITESGRLWLFGNTEFVGKLKKKHDFDKAVVVELSSLRE